MTTAPRTYTRGELAGMSQNDLAVIARDLPAAAAEGRIVDDAPPRPPHGGYAFTRSQIEGMPPTEVTRRTSEIQEALRDNRILFDQ